MNLYKIRILCFIINLVEINLLEINKTYNKQNLDQLEIGKL